MEIAGSFSGWSRRHPMHRSGNDFTYVHMLPRGKHEYKFIVDGHWRFAQEQDTSVDELKNINNIIDLTEF